MSLKNICNFICLANCTVSKNNVSNLTTNKNEIVSNVDKLNSDKGLQNKRLLSHILCIGISENSIRRYNRNYSSSFNDKNFSDSRFTDRSEKIADQAAIRTKCSYLKCSKYLEKCSPAYQPLYVCRKCCPKNECSRGYERMFSSTFDDDVSVNNEAIRKLKNKISRPIYKYKGYSQQRKISERTDRNVMRDKMKNIYPVFLLQPLYSYKYKNFAPSTEEIKAPVHYDVLAKDQPNLNVVFTSSAKVEFPRDKINSVEPVSHARLESPVEELKHKIKKHKQAKTSERIRVIKQLVYQVKAAKNSVGNYLLKMYLQKSLAKELKALKMSDPEKYALLVSKMKMEASLRRIAKVDRKIEAIEPLKLDNKKNISTEENFPPSSNDKIIKVNDTVELLKNKVNPSNSLENEPLPPKGDSIIVKTPENIKTPIPDSNHSMIHSKVPSRIIFNPKLDCERIRVYSSKTTNEIHQNSKRNPMRYNPFKSIYGSTRFFHSVRNRVVPKCLSFLK